MLFILLVLTLLVNADMLKVMPSASRTYPICHPHESEDQDSRLRENDTIGSKSIVNCQLSKKGFTLIEVLITVAIIALLSAIGLYSFQAAQGRARDARRKADMRDLQKAIQLYYQDNKAYPQTFAVGGAIVWYAADPTECCAISNNGGNWIPGLMPTYLPQLLRDPKGGLSSIAGCILAGWKRDYLYASNGTDYKLLAHCAPEAATLDPLDPFFDPVRPAHAWQISTDGGRSW